jgi:hypothetical protein
LGTFCIHLVHFSGFGIKYQEKSGNPGSPKYQTVIALKSVRQTNQISVQEWILLICIFAECHFPEKIAAKFDPR